MGSNPSSLYQPGPCPGCGKPGGGVKGSSLWFHDLMCCSDRCGEQVGEALRAVKAHPKYMRLVDQLGRIRERLDGMQRAAVDAARDERNREHFPKQDVSE